MEYIIYHPDKARLAALQIDWKEGICLLPAFLEEIAAQATAYDGIALPGNSYGLMDGGLDAVAVQIWGDGLQDRVQRAILDDYRGELPVGAAIGVRASEDAGAPYILYAPTMEVPMRITGTVNAYRAATAAIRWAHKNKLSRVYLPLFGECSGGLNTQDVGVQIGMAIQNDRHPPRQISWGMALQRHRMHCDMAAASKRREKEAWR